MRRKEERSKQGQTNNKAKQHSTPKAVTLCVLCVYIYLCIILYVLDTIIISSVSARWVIDVIISLVRYLQNNRLVSISDTTFVELPQLKYL